MGKKGKDPGPIPSSPTDGSRRARSRPLVERRDREGTTQRRVKRWTRGGTGNSVRGSEGIKKRGRGRKERGSVTTRGSNGQQNQEEPDYFEGKGEKLGGPTGPKKERGQKARDIPYTFPAAIL